MEYNFREIEKKWQSAWKDSNAYLVSNQSSKPKYYVLDMFPYPSGAGLHVGHPLGYIASDIFSRYKRLKGFNVLHPMGYDAFGLPAEQYAIDHGIHPSVSTKKNIATFRKQLDNIGFCYDWSREIRTCDEKYYHWTQWIFLQLFDSWFNRKNKKAERINVLVAAFEKDGNTKHASPVDAAIQFSADDWNGYDEKRKMKILMNYRLAFCGYGEVNWCEALGTVLANDEVVNGVSERGGHPVERKKLRQWYLRITEYADRLLDGLKQIEFSEAMNEMQRNWIGKSVGAEIDFKIKAASPPTPVPPDHPGGPLLSERGVKTADSKQSDHYFQTADNTYWKILKEYGKENRKNQTEAEEVLWELLRNNQLAAKVRRQHTIQGYIVDFAFLEVNLVIEVDGDYHNEKEQLIFDEARTRFLNEFNIDVLRFTNEEVIKDTAVVIHKIKAAIEERKQLKQLGSQIPLLREEKGLGDEAVLKVYTTRPDTIFGVDFMVVAPEHELIEKITSAEQKIAVEEYLTYVKSRSERERMAEKKITGVFTGAYALNPFDGREIPIWISEYVLAGYGTGAIMAVPCGDERDHKFAEHFNIPITNIIGRHYNGEEANPTKDAMLENSGFVNGIKMADAIAIVNDKLEELGIGKRKTNFRMRDAAFSRQRYWGEPFPVIWKDGTAYPMAESDLPVLLPHMDELKPGPDGEGPLSNLTDWKITDGGIREVNTMPGYAGSSWYFLRYMDPENESNFCDRKISDYWGQVDLYVGGTEHAVGHLLYSRLWTKVLFDLAYIGFDEPFKKLLNQGMIQGSSRFVYRVHGTKKYVSAGLKDQYQTDAIHVDVNMVDGVELDMNAFKNWRAEFANAEFILENGKYICGAEVEKMSKSKFNTVNPDILVERYGADTFRMYEMFLGPVEMSKPWDTKGIEGVHRFLKKLWRLFFDEIKGKVWIEENANAAELKILHKTIRKIEEDTERFSFNTAVSAFMVCVNELNEVKCHKKEILEQLAILLTPYAPHIAEELWHCLGNLGSVLDASFPQFKQKHILENEKEYPVSINGKLRTTLSFRVEVTQAEVEPVVLQNDIVQKWLEGKPPKKIIFVKNKMINVVI